MGRRHDVGQRRAALRHAAEGVAADLHTRFNDFALEFYSFVADNYAPFYSRPVECTDRDAPFVLDGVLYHESDLNLEEHYTDTHGYTEINFAAFGMVGMRFCPRIRSLHRQRIYCADPARDHGDEASTTSRAANRGRGVSNGERRSGSGKNEEDGD